MTEIVSYTATNLADTQNLGSRLGSALEKIGPPFLILLTGNLGSGKTTFIKSCIAQLSSINTESISSPTFQYVSLYTTKKSQQIAHFDLWRLSDPSLFHTMGLDEIMSASYSFVEWPEKLPNNYLELLHGDESMGITIHVTNEDERIFDLSFSKKHSALFKGLV